MSNSCSTQPSIQKFSLSVFSLREKKNKAEYYAQVAGQCYRPSSAYTSSRPSRIVSLESLIIRRWERDSSLTLRTTFALSDYRVQILYLPNVDVVTPKGLENISKVYAREKNNHPSTCFVTMFIVKLMSDPLVSLLDCCSAYQQQQFCIHPHVRFRPSYYRLHHPQTTSSSPLHIPCGFPASQHELLSDRKPT